MTKRAEWAKRVSALQQSGLTVREYAGRIGVDAHALMNWRWRLRDDSLAGGQHSEKLKSAPRVSFVEILAPKPAPVVAEQAQAEPFEVYLSGDVRVRVPMRFDVASLRDLFSALGDR